MGGPAEARGQMVYFAEAMGADRVKIGVAADPIARLASLQTTCPHPLKLLAKVEGGRALETSLHARLADFHLGGEWFHLAKPVRALVERLQRGEQPET
ncbi:MAG: GIY-YIG nuclease family protein [Pirellulales bacterium]